MYPYQRERPEERPLLLWAPNDKLEHNPLAEEHLAMSQSIPLGGGTNAVSMKSYENKLSIWAQSTSCKGLLNKLFPQCKNPANIPLTGLVLGSNHPSDF